MRETCRRVCQKGNAAEGRAVPLHDTATQLCCFIFVCGDLDGNINTSTCSSFFMELTQFLVRKLIVIAKPNWIHSILVGEFFKCPFSVAELLLNFGIDRGIKLMLLLQEIESLLNCWCFQDNFLSCNSDLLFFKYLQLLSVSQNATKRRETLCFPLFPI